jgi:hypothetical protein
VLEAIHRTVETHQSSLQRATMRFDVYTSENRSGTKPGRLIKTISYYKPTVFCNREISPTETNPLSTRVQANLSLAFSKPFFASVDERKQYWLPQKAQIFSPAKRRPNRSGGSMGALPKHEAVPPPISVEDRLRLVVDMIPCLILRATALHSQSLSRVWNLIGCIDSREWQGYHCGPTGTESQLRASFVAIGAQPGHGAADQVERRRPKRVEGFGSSSLR